MRTTRNDKLRFTMNESGGAGVDYFSFKEMRSEIAIWFDEIESLDAMLTNIPDSLT